LHKSRPAFIAIFRHPLVIFSIALLLVNDHILKAVVPSDLTGKLSDFAGLFFFPFLLATLLEWLARRLPFARNARPETLLLASFALCALVFASVKVFPGANAAVRLALGALFGAPVFIALDPTDLAALLVFLPAWGLWKVKNTLITPVAPGKWVYFVLSTATFAAIATSPGFTPLLNQFAYYEGKIILHVKDKYYNSNDGYYHHDIESNIWAEINELPLEVKAQFANPPVLPLVKCLSTSPERCYRIDGSPQVSVSNDGGSTWSTAWSIPPGRLDYFRRAGFSLFSFNNVEELLTFDLILSGNADQPLVFVAMGDQGLLQYNNEKGWQRSNIVVQTSTDQFTLFRVVPFNATSLDTALSIMLPEGLIGLVFLFIIWTSITRWAVDIARSHPAISQPFPAKAIYKPYTNLLIYLFVLITIAIINGIMSQFTPIVANCLFFAFISLILVGIIAIIPTNLAIWVKAGNYSGKIEIYRRGMKLTLAGSFGIFLVFYGSFIAWAFGWLPVYEVTWVVAILVSAAILARTIIVIRRAFNIEFGPKSE
jgi:hypothetical protein